MHARFRQFLITLNELHHIDEPMLADWATAISVLDRLGAALCDVAGRRAALTHQADLAWSDAQRHVSNVSDLTDVFKRYRLLQRAARVSADCVTFNEPVSRD